MMRKLIIILIASLLSNCELGARSTIQGKLHIFASANINGYLEPCG
jgi:hypothetical protein